MNDPTDSGEPLMNRNETKVDELVRRLKKHPVWTMDKQNVTADAAEVITALQARVHELEVESRRLGEALDFHTDNIEPQMRETITQKDAEIARLHTQTREDRKEIDSLRKTIATENHASIDQHTREVKRAELAERQRDEALKSLEILDTNSYSHHTPHMICVPTEHWKRAMSTTTGEE